MNKKLFFIYSIFGWPETAVSKKIDTVSIVVLCFFLMISAAVWDIAFYFAYEFIFRKEASSILVGVIFLSVLVLSFLSAFSRSLERADEYFKREKFENPA